MGRHIKNNDDSVNIVVGIDFFGMIILGYYLASTYLPQFVTLTHIVIGLGFGILFIILNLIKIVRRIIQCIFALLWAVVIWSLLPLEKITQGSTIWEWLILIILFIIFLALHIMPFENLTPSGSNHYTNADMAMPSYSYDSDIPFNSMDTELYSNVQAKYEKMVQNFTDTLPLYRKCRQKYYGMSIQIDEMFNYMEFNIEHNQQALGQIKNVLEMGNCEKQTLLDIWENLNTFENFIIQIKEFCDMLQKADYESQRQFAQNETTEDTSNMDMFFAGCSDKESVTKRYRQLMKTFHPDNQNGDQKMTQLIQEAYEKRIAMM